MDAPLYASDAVLARPSPVPAIPGVYAWFFRKVPPGVPVDRCLIRDSMPLLYVGISPKAPPTSGAPVSRQTLRSRVRYHYRGNAEGSTLRLTLGCLLADSLRIELRRVGSGKRMTFGTGEAALSAWMAANALVCWVEHPRPWEAEDALIRSESLPLNLQGNQQHPFHARLTAIRAAAKERARFLPVAGR
jgi:hypothetical protein